MKHHSTSAGFCWASLLLPALCPTLVLGAAISNRAPSCHDNHYDGPTNPNFETGDLRGWTIVSGNAYGNASISSVKSYWGGPFNQVGNYYLSGFTQAGDPAVGEVKSSTFRASSVMSFLVGGGYDPATLYVGLVRESDNKMLLSQTGLNDEAFIRIIWDTSAWAGQNVHLVVHDSNTGSGWAHISIDDVRTGCDALGDKGLSFNVMGQSNQPASSSLTTKNRYAADSLRPQFHYTPYQGWINDPAGLIQWNGRHHLFSQFNPVSPFWGPMHWSHADSADAVHWRELPVALTPPYPNNPNDASGRFTGSAISDNGALRVIFTDFTDTSVHPNAVAEVQSTAKSVDGVTFSLYGGNPIIKGPPDGSPSGFRDPKVFWDPTQKIWKMVVGSGDAATGKVQLYKSTDLVTWTYMNVLTSGTGATGTMWECPNFFPIEDKWALFYGGNGVGWYEVGVFNGSIFTPQVSGLLDAGPASYAAQWYKDASDRNLLIAWMGNWGTSKWPSRVNGWAGAQSVTRELFLRADGGLGMKPIAEVASLGNGPSTLFSSKDVRGTFKVGKSNMGRLKLNVDLASTDAPAFTVSLFTSSAESVLLTYTVANKTLTLDTTNAGYGQAGTWSAAVTISSKNVLGLDILIDRSSLEIFSDDGTSMTAAIYPRYQESTEIQLIAHGGKASFQGISLTPFGSSWA